MKTQKVIASPTPNEGTRKKHERPLRNVTCVYCHREFSTQLPPTKEHVIGKKFGPENSIKADDWNLILNACFDCNHAKSQLESEISAITLQPEIATPIDSTLAEQSHRKAAKAKSSRTGKAVADSTEQLNLAGSFGPGVSMSFGLVAAPQLNRSAVETLCEAHLRAFFYRVTYDAKTRRGACWPGGRIAWHRWARRNDWGNTTMRSFAESTLLWRTKVKGITANAFFKIVIKRHPDDKLVWSSR